MSLINLSVTTDIKSSPKEEAAKAAPFSFQQINHALPPKKLAAFASQFTLSLTKFNLHTGMTSLSFAIETGYQAT
ncbi:MAG: hypothetical protein K6C05_04085 [Anaerovibrio sp.]|uniref:hypothetical protein n=1 Tax=Anaerovibrio sp. TaxID=1872532 RepID=UPI0025DD4656|nr:hypothetical protein [Anaerovibrio sp.]MCR5176008.1 hypothetical protein [Anaerovibrio sp.]